MARQLEHAYIRRREENLVSRVIEGEAIVVNLNTGDQYSLNQVGTLVWEMADGRHTLADIVASIVERYEVNVDQAQADLSKLVVDLENEELVAIGEAPTSS